MAHAYTQTTTVLNNTFFVRIVETEAATGSEFQVTGLPVTGRLLKYAVSLVSGSGTTVQPEAGSEAGWATGKAVVEQFAFGSSEAADEISDQTQVLLWLPAQTLYIRSRVDGGTNNRIEHVLVVEELLQGS